jgi:hypothetical protein
MGEHDQAEPRRVTEAGGRTFVLVDAGRGDDLRWHLEDSGIASAVYPAGDRDRVEIPGDMDRRAVQAVVDRWPG